MTKKYDNGTGSREFSSGAPAAKTVPTIEGAVNSLVDRHIVLSFNEIETTSSAAVMSFAAPDKGKVVAVKFINGTTAADGTNGFKLVAINKSNSDDSLFSVGFGTGTNAAAATDAYGAVAAHAVAPKAVSDTSTVNKDDKIEMTITRDGTAIIGVIEVVFEASAVGR